MGKRTDSTTKELDRGISVGLVDTELVAAARALIQDVNDDTASGMNDVPDAAPPNRPSSAPAITDRFGQLYPVETNENDDLVSYDEVAIPMAKGMFARLDRIFKFTPRGHDEGSHFNQLLHAHNGTRVQFEEEHRAVQSWLEEVVCSIHTVECESGERPMVGKNKATEHTRARVGVSDSLASIKHLRTPVPMSLSDFGRESKFEEHRLRVSQYWYQHCHQLARAIPNFFRTGVSKQFFGLIQYDKHCRSARLCWLEKRVVQQAESKENVGQQTYQHVCHEHPISDVTPYDALSALNCRQLVVPDNIQQVIEGAPSYLKPFLEVFDGGENHAPVIAQELFLEQICGESSGCIEADSPPATPIPPSAFAAANLALPPFLALADTALCFARTFCLGGWAKPETEPCAAQSATKANLGEKGDGLERGACELEEEEAIAVCCPDVDLPTEAAKKHRWRRYAAFWEKG